MGNQVIVTNKNGVHIATGSHGLTCAALVEIICQKYDRSFDLMNYRTLEEDFECGLKMLNADLLGVFSKATPEDSLTIQILMYDQVTLTAEHVPILEKAIENYPKLFRDGPKKVLEGYLKLLKTHGEINLEYNGTVVAMTVTKEDKDKPN